MTPLTSATTGIAFLRVSTREQADSRLGLESQIASIRAYCRKHGIELVAVHTDAGVSGRVELTERPGLVAALADVVSRRAGVLLVAKLDRVSRDPYLTLTIEKTLKASGCRLVSVAGEGTEGDDPSQTLMRNILISLSAWEAQVCAARTKAALQAKAARKEWVGRPPKGFTCVAGKLVPNDDWADVLRALHLRQEHATQAAIGAELGWKQPFVARLLKRWKTPAGLVSFTEAL